MPVRGVQSEPRRAGPDVRMPEYPMIQPEIVADQSTLEARCDAWRQAGFIAFDTEFIRDDTYDAILCLIQVTTDGEVVLIDPTAEIDVRCFWDLVSAEEVTTVVHAGKEDFELCLRATGAAPRNVFDVQVAAGFVGYGYPLSLVRLVEMVLHRRIAKGQTLTDWQRRPLTENQIRYAAEDVLYLPQVYEHLCERIEKLKRTDWVREELACFEDPEYYRIPAGERVQRLKGSRRLDGLGLFVLERLVEWRDQWAQAKNRPTRAMMRDDVLVEIARRRPTKSSDLEVMRGFPQAKNRKVVGELLEIIATAASTPKAELPKPQERREETPMGKATVDLLSSVMQAICHEEHLSRNLLGGAQRLRELLDHRAGHNGDIPELLTGWRNDFIGKRLVKLLEGRSEIHLSGWPKNPRLKIVSHGRKSASAR